MDQLATVELDAQYRALRAGCGLLERSARGMLTVSGPDAAEYLQGQLTNEIEALAPGEGAYAALLNRKGHMQADMRVLRLSGEEFWIDTEPEGFEATMGHLQRYKIGRQVVVADLSTERTILSLIGPRSAAIAAVSPLARHASQQIEIAALRLTAAATREGIDLIAPAGAGAPISAALLRAGALPLSPAAVEIGRIESGVPRFGAEMGVETLPAEAGIIEDAVSFTKGCYIGQETVARLHYRGRPNRRLRGLELSEMAPFGAALRRDRRGVGTLASACVSPAHGPIALAIIRREVGAGEQLGVGEDGVTARVVELPFG